MYAFPSPERPGHLVLVLDVFPAAAATALFSDALSYRFRLRPVTATTAGGRPAFVAGADEYTFEISFAVPFPDDGPDSTVQAGTCTTPSGVEIPFEPASRSRPRCTVCGSSPGRGWTVLHRPGRRTGHPQAGAAGVQARGMNAVDGADVLSIILELDTTVLGPDTGPLLAVVGETLTSGGPGPAGAHGPAGDQELHPRDKKFDPVNRDLEIRDLYNGEDAFDLSQTYVGVYRARLNANLPSSTGWTAGSTGRRTIRGVHPLTEVLLADFLVVDTSKPFSDGSFLEIERAVLAGRPHHLRRPAADDDIVDILYTLLVGGLDGPRSATAWTEPTQPATRSFPHLNSPNPDPPDVKAVLLAVASIPPEEATSSPG